VLILKFREKYKWQGPLASGPRRPKAACPGQHASTQVWQYRDGSATAYHLAPTLSADHCHLPSTCPHARRRPYPLPCRSRSSFEHFHSHTLSRLCSISWHATPITEPPASPQLIIAVLVCTRRLWVGVPSLSRHTQREDLEALLRHPHYPPWAPSINNPHQPSSGPVDPGNSFAWAPCYSSTSSLTTSTPPPVQHRCSPPADHHRYGATAVVSLFLSRRLNRAPPHPGLLWVPPPTPSPPTMVGIRPASHRRGKGGSPVSAFGRKAHVGWAAMAEQASGQLGLAHSISALSLFSFGFNSKFNSNLVWTLEIHRDLNKFDKIINSIP
jgi:hypothetical protein